MQTDGKIVELNQIGKKDENLTGEWNHTSGQWNGDANDKGIQTSEDYRFYVISAEYPELGLFVSPDLNQDYLFDVVCSNSLFFICLMNFPCCLIVFIVDMGVQGGDCLVRGAVVMVFEGDGYGCTIFFSCNLW
ncbi:Calreticulin [Glycine max]|nr:Calreticulin [Glycine max]|eukprot:XP_014623343.1 uncharacterized protein LOC106796255 [Glycine max]